MKNHSNEKQEIEDDKQANEEIGYGLKIKLKK